jgi:hypothetical protein
MRQRPTKRAGHLAQGAVAHISARFRRTQATPRTTARPPRTHSHRGRIQAARTRERLAATPTSARSPASRFTTRPDRTRRQASGPWRGAVTHPFPRLLAAACYPRAAGRRRTRPAAGQVRQRVASFGGRHVGQRVGRQAAESAEGSRAQGADGTAGQCTGHRAGRSVSSSGIKHLASRVRRRAGCFRVRIPGSSSVTCLLSSAVRHGPRYGPPGGPQIRQLIANSSPKSDFKRHTQSSV